jgi:uncharacterized phage-associated protein
MMTYDARVVANHMLDRADDTGLSITNLALNKLVYFAHGTYFSSYSRPLVKNAFEAWQFGPVVRVLYDAFKIYENRPIRDRARRFNPVENAFEVISEQLARSDALIVDGVFDMFSPMTAGQLVDLSHEEGSPWAALWESEELVVRPGMIIRDDEIVAHVRRYAA